MKLRKLFRHHSDLSAARNSVETLLTFYPPDAKLSDILNNVEGNTEKWVECPLCKTGGYIHSPETREIITCPNCKGKRWVRKK